HGGHVVADPLHGVEDRHAGVDGAAGRVDVEVDVLVRVLRVQQQHLRADRVGVLVTYLGAEEDDPVRQQGGVDIVVKAEGGPGGASHRHFVASLLGHVTNLPGSSDNRSDPRAVRAPRNTQDLPGTGFAGSSTTATGSGSGSGSGGSSTPSTCLGF